LSVFVSHAGNKTLLQQNPSFLNYWCQLTKLDLYNVHEMVVCNS